MTLKRCQNGRRDILEEVDWGKVGANRYLAGEKRVLFEREKREEEKLPFKMDAHSKAAFRGPRSTVQR